MVVVLPMMLLSLAITLNILVPIVSATTPNEFIVQASNYDKLASHANNCTFVIEADFAFTYCEDGYIAIDEARNLLNPSTAFKIDSKWA